MPLTLSSSRIRIEGPAGAMPACVRLALEDLQADLQRIFGEPTGEHPPATLVLEIDPTAGDPESYQLVVGGEGVRITAADALGLVYGVYAFSERCLGVDPLWFWKATPPAARDRIVLDDQRIASSPPAFAYRGWFINDEDLLTGWKPGPGRRHFDYPFYQQVIHPEVADRVFEAALRCGCNLIIPASFVDVFNDDEAALVERAVARGLYVTQHHIEPLGVSHFGFENYWARKGQSRRFSYGVDREAVTEAWEASARRWWELAGDRVIWQLGLRGRGDRPIWADDRSVSREAAGRSISEALATQMQIVRRVDPRPNPPATMTCFREAYDLAMENSLHIPEGVIRVFSNECATLTMQDDFRLTPREEPAGYGVYHHIAFWSRGSHLVQGVSPRNVGALLRQVIDKGDTRYVIVNVSNIRENVLPIAAWAEIVQQGTRWDEDVFWRRWCPPTLRGRYERFFDALAQTPEGIVIKDGHAAVVLWSVLNAAEAGSGTPYAGVPWVTDAPGLVADLRAGRDQLAALSRESLPDEGLSPAERQFFHHNLNLQAGCLALLYDITALMLERGNTPGAWGPVAERIEAFLAYRQQLEAPPWEHWYRGEAKAAWPDLLSRVRRAAGVPGGVSGGSPGGSSGGN